MEKYYFYLYDVLDENSKVVGFGSGVFKEENKKNSALDSFTKLSRWLFDKYKPNTPHIKDFKVVR